VVKGLKAICKVAEEKRIGLVLETHQGHLHDTSATSLRLIRQVGASNLGINLDIHNLYAMGEDPVQAARRLMPWVRIMHLKNRPRGVERGAAYLAEGDMDYAPFMAEVLKLNYGGFASIEWFGADPAAAAKVEIAYLRKCWGDHRKKEPATTAAKRA
jgi:sugar phosphate isomerase/epimerase